MARNFCGLLLVAAFLSGCYNPKPISPREAFLVRTPDRSAYAKLYEVSPESLRQEEDRILRITQAIVRGIREAKEGGGPLEDHLAHLDYVAKAAHKESLDLIEKLEKSYDPETDVLLFFHHWVGDDQEIGYIITRDGVPQEKFLIW